MDVVDELINSGACLQRDDGWPGCVLCGMRVVAGLEAHRRHCKVEHPPIHDADKRKVRRGNVRRLASYMSVPEIASKMGVSVVAVRNDLRALGIKAQPAPKRKRRAKPKADQVRGVQMKELPTGKKVYDHSYVYCLCPVEQTKMVTSKIAPACPLHGDGKTNPWLVIKDIVDGRWVDK